MLLQLLCSVAVVSVVVAAADYTQYLYTDCGGVLQGVGWLKRENCFTASLIPLHICKCEWKCTCECEFVKFVKQFGYCPLSFLF